MNKYEGDNFESFLKEEGIFDEVTERAHKRLLIMEIEDMVNAANQNRTVYFEKTDTDFIELNHYLFNIDNTVITSELLKTYIHEAKEMEMDPVQLNDPLFDSEELVNSLLTDEAADYSEL